MHCSDASPNGWEPLMAESIAPPGRRSETVLRHRGPHYLCPQCRDINPLHLNARRARFAYSSRFPPPRGRRGEAEKSREQKEGRRRRKRYEERPHFTSPCIRGPLASLCARRIVPLVLEFSGTSGVRVGLLPRSRGRTLEFYRHLLLTVNKATCGGLARRTPRGTRNNFTHTGTTRDSIFTEYSRSGTRSRVETSSTEKIEQARIQENQE